MPDRPVITRRDFLQRTAVGAAALGAAGLTGVLPGCRARAAPPRPNILLITLDTTRADHLGCYGYARDTSPHIDRFAEQALRYTRAYAPATWTLPAHASLFTGKYPSSHGARHDPEGSLRLTSAIEGNDKWNQVRVRSIASDEHTLAATLGAQGYDTGAIVGGPFLKSVFGLDRGFGHYDEANISTFNGRPADDVTRAAMAWLGERDHARPWMLFLNYFDPHAPYAPPGDYARRFLGDLAPKPGEPITSGEQVIGLYDAEIAYMDEHVGALFDGLRERGLFDDTWIILTADHGEMLGEHDMKGHGDTPYEPVVHLPLMVKAPGVAGGSRGGSDARPIELVDIMPTILARLKIDPPGPMQGATFDDAGHPIVIESRTLPVFNTQGSWRALIDGPYKYIWNSEGNHMLFDLEADPAEMVNLVATQAQRARAMDAQLAAFLDALPAPGADAGGELDDATRRALEGVGYIE